MDSGSGFPTVPVEALHPIRPTSAGRLPLPSAFTLIHDCLVRALHYAADLLLQPRELCRD